MGYLSNFIVYMLAMVGLMMLALFIFKHSMGYKSKSSSGKCLKVLDTLSLGARKTLYIVAAGNEKFLIAGDVDRTSLISKLNSQNTSENLTNISVQGIEEIPAKSFKETLNTLPQKESYMDRSNLGIKNTQRSPYESVMKSLAERIRG